GGNVADVRGFVEAASGKGDREGFNTGAAQFPSVMKNGRRVDSSAEPNSKRHISNQMIANGLAQQTIELFLRTFQGLLLLRLEAQTPIRFHFDVPILPFQQMPWRKLFDAAHERVR